MPAARRSGRANTSKATTSSSHRDAGGSSSSRLKGEGEPSSSLPSRRSKAEEEESRQAAEREAAEEEERLAREAAEKAVERVHELLDRFDREEVPLTGSNSDAKLKSLRNDWASMEGNFEIAFQLATQVAERLAEARAAEGLIDEDDSLLAIDVGVQELIDEQVSVKYRRQALEEIRDAVNEGKSLVSICWTFAEHMCSHFTLLNLQTNAAKYYTDQGSQLDEEYDRKTKRQKYAQSKVYKDYKSTVWVRNEMTGKAALREDDMPALVDILPAEPGDDEDGSDDEIVTYGGDNQRFKCPLSLHIMIDPLKSKVCQHAFEKEHILEFLGDGTKQCPTGCPARLNKRNLASDPNFTRACRKYAQRQESRRERERTQHQGTMID
jgi:SUMO ligase MMS21 Smc5/6 complex component